jgi:hypothetical protein
MGSDIFCVPILTAAPVWLDELETDSGIYFTQNVTSIP